jgi:hypothetical protein
LGPEVCDFIVDKLVHGPGDILGEDVELIDEVRLLIYRAYEVYPHGHRLAGRRRFKRVVYSRRKGVGKTEVAVWLAIAEMDPEAPVRCDGFHKVGREWIPVGRPVRDPYIPMVATTEEQTEDLAYGGVFAVLSHERCSLVDDYDVGLDRIVHKDAPGKMQALAAAPRARDGARTSFQHFDETHLFTEHRLREAHQTMQRNIPKRYKADAWSLETTTMYAPGENSIAEGAHLYALEVARGKIADSALLFDHRQAAESHDIKTPDGLKAAIEEASGDALPYTDREAITAMFHDPTASEASNRRYWLNQRRKSDRKWMSVDGWDLRHDEERQVKPTDPIVVFFDGSSKKDSTVLIGATIEEEPFIFKIDAWEKALDAQPSWRIPRSDVEDRIREVLKDYAVEELACDPHGWWREVEDWQRWFGDIVAEYDTTQAKLFGPACENFENAVAAGSLSHDGDEIFSRHIGNCVAENRRGYTVVTKAFVDSPDKIDAAVGAIGAHARAIYLYGQDDDAPSVWVVGPENDEGEIIY